MKKNIKNISKIAVIASMFPLLLSSMPLETYAKWGNGGDVVNYIDRDGKRFYFKAIGGQFGVYTCNNLQDVSDNINKVYTKLTPGTNEQGISQGERMPNFKLKATPINDFTWDNEFDGSYINPEVVNTALTHKIDVTGKAGEWRYIGYSKFGDRISNPFFPVDYVNNHDTKAYGYRYKPWNHVPDNYLITASRYDDKLQDAYLYKEKMKAIKEVLTNPNVSLETAKLLENPRIVKPKYKDPNMLDENKKPIIDEESTNEYEAIANRLSMQISPFDTMGVFEGTEYHEPNDGRGVTYRTLVTPRDPKYQNLRITKLSVKKISNDDELGSFTRCENEGSVPTPTIHNVPGKKVTKGNYYRATITVKDMNSKSKGTSEDPTTLATDMKTGSSAIDNGFLTSTIAPAGSGTASESGVISPSGYKTLTYDFRVPLDANPEKKFSFRTWIPQLYADNYENMDPVDDKAYMIFDVSEGDLIAKDSTYNGQIQLIDKNGDIVSKIIPGQPYKIRYNVLYKGDNLDFPVDVPVNINITEHTQQGDIKNPTTLYNRGVQLQNNQELTFETNYKVYNTPNIDTTIQVEPSTNDLGINDKLNNDVNDGKFTAYYDYSIHNLRAIPGTLKIDKPGQYRFNIKYDIDFDIPSDVNLYEQDLLIKTRVNGNDYSLAPKRVYVGKNSEERRKNKDITQEIVVNNINPNNLYNIPVDVLINADKAVYEDDYTNNLAGTEVKMEKGYEPSKCGSGVITSLNWVQEYFVHNWSGQVSKAKNPDGTTTPYISYNTTDTKKDVSQNETYSIDKIEFKSKLTEDTQGGWVNITDGAPGRIKAGYGFELRINVSYDTNALITQPKPWTNLIGDTELGSNHPGVSYINGQNVSPQHIYPNLPDELFIETPDGKTLSVTGFNGTYSGLVKTAGGRNGDRTTWTYEIKPTDTLGVKNASKIYIGENVKDGKYGFKIYTPEIFGIGSEFTNKSLCDLKNLYIEVVGGDTDDINTHIIQ